MAQRFYHPAAEGGITQLAIKGDGGLIELEYVQFDGGGAFGGSPSVDSFHEQTPNPLLPVARFDANAINKGEAAGDQDRDGWGIANEGMDKANQLLALLGEEQANTLISDQFQEVSIFPNGTVGFLEQMRQMGAMQLVHFIEELAEGGVVLGEGFADDQ